jgi:hypothetical protein
MRLVGQLKTMKIDNKFDKDGDPDPRMVLTLEFKFTETDAARLCSMIDGSQLSVEINELQPSLFTGKGSPHDDPQSGTHGGQVQPEPAQGETLALPFGQAVEEAQIVEEGDDPEPEPGPDPGTTEGEDDPACGDLIEER